MRKGIPIYTLSRKRTPLEVCASTLHRHFLQPLSFSCSFRSFGHCCLLKRSTTMTTSSTIQSDGGSLEISRKAGQRRRAFSLACILQGASILTYSAFRLSQQFGMRYAFFFISVARVYNIMQMSRLRIIIRYFGYNVKVRLCSFFSQKYRLKLFYIFAKVRIN